MAVPLSFVLDVPSGEGFCQYTVPVAKNEEREWRQARGAAFFRSRYGRSITVTVRFTAPCAAFAMKQVCFLV
jgi:hypothetical protein